MVVVHISEEQLVVHRWLVGGGLCWCVKTASMWHYIAGVGAIEVINLNPSG